MIPSKPGVATMASTARTPAGDSIIPNTSVVSAAARACSARADEAEAARPAVGREAASARAAGSAPTPTRAAACSGVSTCGATTPCAPASRTRRTSAGSWTADPDQHGDAVELGQPRGAGAAHRRRPARARSRRSTKSKPLTATISTSSSAGIRSRAPSSCPRPRAGPSATSSVTPPSPPRGRRRLRSEPRHRQHRDDRGADLVLGDHPAQGGPRDEGLLGRGRRSCRSARPPAGSCGPSAARPPGRGRGVLTLTPGGPTSKASVDGQPDHRHLRGRVRGATDQRALARHRRDVDRRRRGRAPIIGGRKARHIRKTPRTLTSKTSSHSSTLISSGARPVRRSPRC